jgi:hypothetical protein
MARRGARGEEGRPGAGGDRLQEHVRRHVDERRALVVAAGDEVERNVDAARLRGHGVGVLVDGALVIASTTATSARPPAAVMSTATRSRGSRVRPARNTVAPSRANVRATPPPMSRRRRR